MSSSGLDTERRNAVDRRQKPTHPLRWRSLFGGRRRGPRREGENSVYVDQYNPKLLFPILLIMALCAFDAIATLMHIGEDIASELNPFMAYAINLGPIRFFILKYLLTFLGVLILVMHHSFPKVRSALWGILICYLLIGLFHWFIFYKYW
jgi:hypothetical protein